MSWFSRSTDEALRIQRVSDDSSSVELQATVPNAPSNLTATLSGFTVNLAWTDNSSNETGFLIQRSLTGTSGWTQIGTVAPNATSFASTGLTCETRYYYRVRATNEGGNSSASNSASATTVTCAPTWRLSFPPTDTTTPMLVKPGVWQENLRRLTRRSPLVSVLMQIGEQQVAYLGMNGCARCGYGVRHEVGCFAGLMQRSVTDCFGQGTEMNRVSKGLTDRPYTRIVLAWPRAGEATPLDGTMLNWWNEARMVVWWRRKTLDTAALLAVGSPLDEAPEPAEALQTFGWETRELSPFTPRWLHWLRPLTLLPPLPPGHILPLFRGKRVFDSPWVLLPYHDTWTLPPYHDTSFVSSPDALPVVTLDKVSEGPSHKGPSHTGEQPCHQSLASALVRGFWAGGIVVSDEEMPDGVSQTAPVTTLAATESEMEEPEEEGEDESDTEQAGDTLMTPAVLEQIIEALVTSATQKDSTVPRKLVKSVLAKHTSEEQTNDFLAWLDRAEVLEPPQDERDPWRYPRRLITLDTEMLIMQMLRTEQTQEVVHG